MKNPAIPRTFSCISEKLWLRLQHETDSSGHLRRQGSQLFGQGTHHRAYGATPRGQKLHPPIGSPKHHRKRTNSPHHLHQQRVLRIRGHQDLPATDGIRGRQVGIRRQELSFHRRGAGHRTLRERCTQLPRQRRVRHHHHGKQRQNAFQRTVHVSLGTLRGDSHQQSELQRIPALPQNAGFGQLAAPISHLRRATAAGTNRTAKPPDGVQLPERHLQHRHHEGRDYPGKHPQRDAT